MYDPITIYFIVLCCILFVTVFLSSLLSMSCHSLLACRISVERSAVSFMGTPLYVICCFFLAAFNICSLCLILISLISMCLVFLWGFILYETLWASWIWVAISFPMLGNFMTIISNIFSYLFSSSSGIPYNSNICMLNVVTEFSETILISFHYFFFILLCLSYFYHLSSSSLIYSSASDSLLLFPSSVFLISVTVLLTGDCLFFNSSMSLLTFLITSWFVPLVYLSVPPFCL